MQRDEGQCFIQVETAVVARMRVMSAGREVLRPRKGFVSAVSRALAGSLLTGP
jgi:hypothetical protein